MAIEYQYPEHQQQRSTRRARASTTSRPASPPPIAWRPSRRAARDDLALGGGGSTAPPARWEKLDGVLNGIDEKEWNPATDKLIAANYTRTYANGKAECKRAQREMGPENPEAPLCIFIGRLDPQKADIVIEAAPWIADQGAQLVMLGTGQTHRTAWRRLNTRAGTPCVVTWALMSRSRTA